MSETKKKVLHVDDEDSIREIVASILGLHDIEVMEAANPDEAMEVLKVHKDELSLVISDFMMPQKSGIDLLKDIQREGIEVPLIFLSAFKSEENKRKSRELGVEIFIEKPFDSAEFARLISDLVSE